MTETRPHAVWRRFRNITNTFRGIDEYTDEHGTTHRGPDVDTYLDKQIAADGPLKPDWLERLFRRLEENA